MPTRLQRHARTMSPPTPVGILIKEEADKHDLQ
jgi:hypothetical protein